MHAFILQPACQHKIVLAGDANEFGQLRTEDVVAAQSGMNPCDASVHKCGSSTARAHIAPD